MRKNLIIFFCVALLLCCNSTVVYCQIDTLLCKNITYLKDAKYSSGWFLATSDISGTAYSFSYQGQDFLAITKRDSLIVEIHAKNPNFITEEGITIGMKFKDIASKVKFAGSIHFSRGMGITIPLSSGWIIEFYDENVLANAPGVDVIYESNEGVFRAKNELVDTARLANFQRSLPDNSLFKHMKMSVPRYKDNDIIPVPGLENLPVKFIFKRCGQE